jgi:hypothetical protein
MGAVKVITAITRNAHLAENQSPCLDLPAEAWDEPCLRSECPLCHQPLKFNPFHARLWIEGKVTKVTKVS